MMADFKRFRKANKWTQSDAGGYFGCGQSFISQIETGERAIPPDYISKTLLDANIKGKEFLTDSIAPNAREYSISDHKEIPVVPVRAQAGYLVGYADPEYIDELPTMPVIVDRSYKGRYMCFEIEGDSMDDNSRRALCDRDVVLGRELQKHLWRNKLHLHDWPVWVIVHRTDGILIKEVINHNIDTGDIICHSWNELYAPDFTVNLSEVEELYNIVRIVDRSIR